MACRHAHANPPESSRPRSSGSRSAVHPPKHSVASGVSRIILDKEFWNEQLLLTAANEGNKEATD